MKITSRLRSSLQPGFIMFKSLLFMLTLLGMASISLSAQTPVEKLVLKYEDTDGARNFIAQGVGMSLARRFLKSTQVAPIAPDVDQLYILKMGNTSPNIQQMFARDLAVALRSYEYYGKQPSNNGEVNIYIHKTGPDTVDELVIYNPANYLLNSLYGHFTMQELMDLEKK